MKGTLGMFLLLFYYFFPFFWVHSNSLSLILCPSLLISSVFLSSSFPSFLITSSLPSLFYVLSPFLLSRVYFPSFSSITFVYEFCSTRPHSSPSSFYFLTTESFEDSWRLPLTKRKRLSIKEKSRLSNGQHTEGRYTEIRLLSFQSFLLIKV